MALDLAARAGWGSEIGTHGNEIGAQGRRKKKSRGRREESRARLGNRPERNRARAWSTGSVMKLFPSSVRVSCDYRVVGNRARECRGHETNSFSLLLVSCKNCCGADVSP
jgi:hypothetical protein